MKFRFVIIGAGPTGLGAAYRLKELGVEDVLILEATDHCGGLASSFVDDVGFTWDIGGHVQFSHYPYFDEAMDRALGRDGWLQHDRNSSIWMRNRFIPYPLQNNIHHLPEVDVQRCIQGLVALKSRMGHPENFRDWIRASFGDGIAEVFMEPYNFKVWAFAPEKLSFGWVSDRVATFDVDRMIEDVAKKRDQTSWGPNRTFRFPKRGGTGAIWAAIAAICGQDRIRVRSEVTAVSSVCRTVTLGAEVIGYDHLLSTMPIDRLVDLTDGLPDSLKQLGKALKHSSSNIVGIGIRGTLPKKLQGRCWIYFPEPDCPFYRVTVFSNYSPANVPSGGAYWSLMAEVSESPEKPVHPGTLMDKVIGGLKRTGLLPEDADIASRWSYRAPYGYPTPSLERDGLLGPLSQALEDAGIQSRGRFGAWKYEVSNQDHSFMQGVEWADRMVSGKPETISS